MHIHINSHRRQRKVLIWYWAFDKYVWETHFLLVEFFLACFFAAPARAFNFRCLLNGINKWFELLEFGILQARLAFACGLLRFGIQLCHVIFEFHHECCVLLIIQVYNYNFRILSLCSAFTKIKSYLYLTAYLCNMENASSTSNETLDYNTIIII